MRRFILCAYIGRGQLVVLAPSFDPATGLGVYRLGTNAEWVWGLNSGPNA